MQVYINIFIIFLFTLACAREKHEGIILDEAELSKVKIGIEKPQVESLLGSPSIEIPQIENELPAWIYVSSEKKWYAFFYPTIETQTVIEIQFKNNLVFQIKSYSKEDVKTSNFSTKIKDYNKPD